MKTFLSVAFLVFSLIISSSLWGMEVKEKNKNEESPPPTRRAEGSHDNRNQAAQHDANSGSSNPNNGSPTAVLTSTSEKSPSQDRNTSSNQNMSNRIPDEKLGTSYSSTGAPRANAPRAEGELGPYTVSLSDERPSENTPRFPEPHSIFSSFREQELPRIDGVNPELVSAWINAQSDAERMPIFSTMVNNISSLNRSQMSDQDQDALLERLNQIKQEHYVENVTRSNSKIKAAGGGGVIQESGKEIGKLTKKEQAAAGVNIINRLAQKKSAQLPAEFLVKDLEEKRTSYQEEYNKALGELKELCPDMLSVFKDKNGIPKREDVTAWKKKVKDIFPQFENREKALKLNALVNRIDALRRAIAILDVARWHRDCFLGAIAYSEGAREVASYYAQIEETNRTLTHLEEAAASTLELVKEANNNLRSEQPGAASIRPLIEEHILLNTEYAEAIRDGNRERATALYINCLKSQADFFEFKRVQSGNNLSSYWSSGKAASFRAATAIETGDYETADYYVQAVRYHERVARVHENGDDVIAEQLKKAATYSAFAGMASEDAAKARREGENGVALFYDQKARFYQEAARAYAHGKEDLARHLSEAGNNSHSAADASLGAAKARGEGENGAALLYDKAARYYQEGAQAYATGNVTAGRQLMARGNESLKQALESRGR